MTISNLGEGREAYMAARAQIRELARNGQRNERGISTDYANAFIPLYQAARSTDEQKFWDVLGRHTRDSSKPLCSSYEEYLTDKNIVDGYSENNKKTVEDIENYVAQLNDCYQNGTLNRDLTLRLTHNILTCIYGEEEFMQRVEATEPDNAS